MSQNKVTIRKYVELHAAIKVQQELISREENRLRNMQSDQDRLRREILKDAHIGPKIPQRVYRHGNKVVLVTHIRDMPSAITVLNLEE